MDTATCYLMSDPTRNRHFHRRWSEPPRPAPTPAPAATDAEPGMAKLLRWRDEWRARRSKEAPRPARACP